MVHIYEPTAPSEVPMDENEIIDDAAPAKGRTSSMHIPEIDVSEAPEPAGVDPSLIPEIDDAPQSEVPDEEPAAEATPRTTYVRRRAPRRTQEAIDDLAEDDSPIEYAHESNIAVGGMIADRKYRRARSDISQIQTNNRYGQYLEIPKGRRSIFAKRERSRRRKSALAAIVVVGILAIVAYIVWQIMLRISF